MERMRDALESDGYIVKNVNYLSRSAKIEILAEEVISEVLQKSTISKCKVVHFVTHSLGGILVRFYFEKHTDRRLGRVVMIGPPNKGSEVVDHLKEWYIFKKLNGPAGSQLGTSDDSLVKKLGPVCFELGVIAGDRSINLINSLMIPGPDDGKVSVESTKIVGMKDHKILHTTHPFMMKNAQVIQDTMCFLKTGFFQKTG